VVPFSFAEILGGLIEGRELSTERIQFIVQEMMAGRLGDVEAGAFLTALRAKGETAGEIAAAATVLRGHMVRFDCGRDDVLDTCGTGGDGTGTFNISTAAAFVVAGAGVAVVKHGNRAMSSQSGSADVLAALGVPVEGDASWARRCLDRAGLAFCFAPHYHPALRHVGAVRRRLGIRTLFNLLGPLVNPAGAAHQLLGVGRPELLDKVAGALCQLGTRHALVVCGQDGLDEVSLSGPTLVREVHRGLVKECLWTPGDFGLEPCAVSELRVASAEASAACIQGILAGQRGPAARVVLANAAAGLLAAERVGTLAEGVARAHDAIVSGRARQVIDTLVACSHAPAVAAT
jgi:anthranilate phosphoribosyltransferase